MRPHLSLIALFLAPAVALGAPMEFDYTLLDGSFDGAMGMVTGDLDHDGVPDLVSTAYSGNQVKIWLSPTPSSFASSAVVSVGQNPGWPRLRDIDRDGDLDIFVGSFGSDELVWLENDGSGGGWGSHTVSTDQNPWAVELGDVDGDGDEDLVVGSYDDGTQDVRWYENLDGVGGSWGSAVSISASAFEAWHLILVDFDDDGHLDVVATDEAAEEIRWWLNDGDASGWTSTSALSFPSGSYPQTVKVFDMDRDGDLDIVCSFSRADDLNWYENDGSLGTWTEHTVATPGRVQENELVDLDLDGDVDIVASSMSQSDVIFFEALDGSGDSWSADTIEANLGTPMRVAPFDWEQDGDLDLAVTGWFDDDVRIYRNLSLHGTTWDWSYGGRVDGDNARVTEVVDFDGDGDLDFFGSGTNDISLNINDGTGDFTSYTLTVGTSAFWALSAGDVDGDGDIDVATISNNAQEVRWYENNGSLGLWSIHSVHSTGGTTYGRDIELADLDRDGDLDIVSGEAGQDDLIVHINDNGVGTSWTQVVMDAAYSNVEAVEVIDFDRDGHLDVVACAMNESTVGIWYGDGSGTAWTYQATASISGCREVMPVDMDFDGDYDLVATDGTNGNVLLYTNAGDNLTFAQSTIGSGFNQTPHAIPVDLDKDGDYDIVASGYDEVVAIFQDGGSWGAPVRLRNGNTVVDGAVGDFDLDGDIDVLYPDIGTDDWRLTLNDWANARSTVEDQSPADPMPGDTNVLLSTLTLEPGHQPGEGDMTLGGTLSFLFEDLAGTALTQGEVEALFAAVDVWVDNGDGFFSVADTLDGSLTSLPVTNGAVDLTISDTDLGAYAEQVLWITADIGTDASLMTVLDVYIGVSFAGAASDSYGRTLTVLGVDDDTYLGVDLGSVPVAILNGPYTADEGDSVLVDGTGSTDSDGNISTYEFDCDGDGVFEVSQLTTGTSCVWADDGTYTVSLRVTDTYGNTSTTSTTATVANVAPTLSISGSTTLSEGASQTWSVSAVDPGDDTISGYLWTLEDASGTPVTSATTATFTYTFPDDGSFTLYAAVLDEDGSYSTSVALNVQNVDPALSGFSGTAAPVEGVAEAYSINVSDAAGDVVTLAWSLVDLTSGRTVATATGTSVSITVPDGGTYVLGVTATDDDGGSSSFAAVLMASNAAPTVVVSGSTTPDEGATETYTATTSDVAADTVTVAWTLHDAGGASIATATGSTASFTFPDDGAYTVVATATDSDGASSSDSMAVIAGNVAPTVVISGASAAVEGVAEGYAVTVTDPGDDTVNAWAWSVEDAGGAVVDTSSSASPSFTFPDDGAFTVEVSVTDEDGTWSASFGVTVSNTAPTVAVSGPSTADEGDATTYTATTSDVSGDTVTVSWELQDAGGAAVDTATGASASLTFPDDGTYTVVATATDGDGGTSTDSLTVTVSNVDPTANMGGPTTANEGETKSYGLASTDVAADTVTIDWELQDAGGAVLDTATGTNASFTFDDDGTYTVAATATDEDGGSASDSKTVVVSNLDPTVAIASGTGAMDEGSTETFTATASDPVGDPLTVTWEFSLAGTVVDTATGLSVTFTPTDEGTYDVVVTADDGDGGTATATETITVSNVAPTITSTATTTVTEGSSWSYEPSVTEPGADTLVWTTSGAPAAMTSPTGTGAIEWVPAYADVGDHTFTLDVSDGDGGADSETITITVSYLDADADGMPDTWETANSLDPTVDDSALDPDADGITNYDEWLDGTDPQVYDGPSAPVATAPVFGAEVATATPTLTWDNATDPSGDTLTYEVEVWADATLSVLIDSTMALAEDASGSTSWTPSSGPAENGVGYWRVRASDPYVDGPWTNLEFFTVNATEEAPGVPVASAPLTGDSVSTTTPTLSWLAPTDPDGDPITYDVTIWDAAGTTVIEDVVGIGSLSWAPVNPLSEDTTYLWEVQAVDDTGLASGWSAAEEFFVDTNNDAPSDVAWVSPLEGDAIEPTSPTLEVTASVDPEGSMVTYQWELDLVSTFDSADLVTGSTSAETWELGSDSVVLTENVDWYARVRTQDLGGAASAWQTVMFFVRGPNDAPGAPSLVAPVDEALYGPDEATPTLVAGHVTDAEGDPVTYGFVLARDEALTDVVESVSDLDASAGPEGTADQTSWLPVTVLDAGVFYWGAIATDDGGASATSEVWSFEVEAPAGDDDDSAGDDDDSVGDDDDSVGDDDDSVGDDDDSVGDDDDSVGDDDDSSDGGPTGCDCESSVAGSGAKTGGTLSILCLFVFVRRRRRTPAGPMAP